MDDFALTEDEAKFQSAVAELEWPAFAEDQFAIMEVVAEFIAQTATSQRRTAAIIGWPESTLRDRLARFYRSMDGRLVSAHARKSGPNGPDEKKLRVARRVIEDPETLDTLLEDPEVLQIITHRITGGGSQTKKELSVSEYWQKWLIRLNSMMTDGARLQDRTEKEQSALSAYAEAARLMYGRLVEKQLDAELRAMLEMEGAS